MRMEELRESIEKLLKADSKSIDKIQNDLLRQEAKKIRSM